MKDIISKTLGTKSSLTDEKKELIKKTEDIKDEAQKVLSEKDKEKEEVKDNIKKVIENGMTLIPDMIALTRELQNSKMYESASIYMKTLVEMNKTLLELDREPKQKKTEEKKVEEPKEESQQVNNFFFGTTDDLLDKLKQTRKNQEAIDVSYEEVDQEEKKPKRLKKE